MGIRHTHRLGSPRPPIVFFFLWNRRLKHPNCGVLVNYSNQSCVVCTYPIPQCVMAFQCEGRARTTVKGIKLHVQYTVQYVHVHIYMCSTYVKRQHTYERKVHSYSTNANTHTDNPPPHTHTHTSTHTAIKKHTHYNYMLDFSTAGLWRLHDGLCSQNSKLWPF